MKTVQTFFFNRKIQHDEQQATKKIRTFNDFKTGTQRTFNLGAGSTQGEAWHVSQMGA